MMRVGYEKLGERHYRRHLAVPGAERTLCGRDLESLSHLHPILDPSGFLAIGVDAEECRKCAVKASVENERHTVASHHAPAPGPTASPAVTPTPTPTPTPMP